ncbi:uncharacterized protein FA14DRAFT_181924 [Meira miltonrushii]|uniref:Uncharacterized protein n=1 Tax=Meira miltonrushii TaxID=1280837 RepID=A0A316V956_9BASI|nr:uncharacterized protein FA14DRAFT_181924 [Meira miltonrushii]PWN32005.1 hypothetical protein FA14DRAFT_181924 [Meira miltonrushii]
MYMTYTIVSYILLHVLLKVNSSQSPTRSQSPGGFNWRELLVDSPKLSSEVVDKPTPHTSLYPTKKEILLSGTNTRSSRDTAPPQERTKDVSTHESLLKGLKKERRRIANRETHERHRQKLREKIGFSSTRDARMYHFRQLERTGEINAHQQKILDEDRARKRRWKKAADERKALQRKQERYDSQKDGKEKRR